MNVDEALEGVLKDCTRRLAGIELRVPELEAAAPPRVEIAPFFPAPSRRIEPEVRRPTPTPAPAAEPAVRPVPSPRLAPPPSAPIEDEEEYFPPRVTPPPVRAPAPRPAPAAARPEPATPSRPSARVLAAGAAGVLALSVVLAVSTHRRKPEVQLDLNGAGAMTFRPDRRELLSARAPDLLTVSLDGAIAGRSDLGGSVAAMSWSNGSLWSVDGQTPEAVERRDGARPTVFHLNHVPSAIFARDSNVWTVEKDGHSIHQYLISRSILGALLQPLDLLEVPELSPEAIALDDSGMLWALDTETRALYKMRADRGVYRKFAAAPLSPLFGPSAALSGLALDGDAVWLMSSAAGGAATVRRVRLDRLEWTPF